jgi:hypothetical protein
MTDAFRDPLEGTVAGVAAITDPEQRVRAAIESRQRIAEADRDLYAIERAGIQELKHGRTWAEVGRLFGRSHAWAEAIATGRSAKRRKSEHADESTPPARVAEGHRPDTTAT